MVTSPEWTRRSARGSGWGSGRALWVSERRRRRVGMGLGGGGIAKGVGQCIEN